MNEQYWNTDNRTAAINRGGQPDRPITLSQADFATVCAAIDAIQRRLTELEARVIRLDAANALVIANFRERIERLERLQSEEH